MRRIELFPFNSECNSLSDLLSKILIYQAEEPLFYIRNRNRRKIFVIEFNSKNYLIKAFPYKRLKEKIYKYKNYALKECRNLMIASEKNIPIPQLLAYFKIKGLTSFIVHCDGIVLEYLKDYKPIREILKEIENLDPFLNKLIELIVNMHKKFFYHLDLHLNHILINIHNYDVKVIDLHHVFIDNKPNIKAFSLIVSMIAQIMRNINIDENIITDWINKCFVEININYIPEDYKIIADEWKNNWLKIKDRWKWIKS